GFFIRSLIAGSAATKFGSPLPCKRRGDQGMRAAAVRSRATSVMTCGGVLLFGFMTIASVTAFPATAQAKRTSGSMRHPETVSQDVAFFPWRRVPAHSIFLKELNSGRVIYQHESGKRLSPASLTKIMSALVILEQGRLDHLVTVSPTAA